MSETHESRDSGTQVAEFQDGDVLCLNPLYRFRSEHDHVLLYGWEGRGNYSLDRAHGIALSLFDGRRTIADIARLVMPFVEENGKDVYAEARSHVRTLAQWFTMTKTEQDKIAPSKAAAIRSETESSSKPSPTARPDMQLLLKDPAIPSDAALVPLELLPRFASLPPYVCDTKSLLPEFAPPLADPRCPGKLSAPLSIILAISNHCVVDCQYCYLGRHAVRSAIGDRLLSKKRLLDIIKEANDLKVPCVFLGGEDVMLAPYLFDALGAVQEYTFLPIRLSTKAPVSLETARRLKEYSKIWELQFSLDSTDEALADALVNKPGFCHAALQSIDNALAAGLRVTSKAVITSLNIRSIPKLYRDLRRRGVTIVRMASYVRTAYRHRDALFNNPDDFRWLDQELDKLRDEFPNDAIFVQGGAPVLDRPSQEILEQKFAKRGSCTAGRSSIMICADGKVIPCEQMPETDEMFCGDVAAQTLSEAWRDPKLAALTTSLPKEHFHGTACEDCPEREECHNRLGYCVRDSYNAFGSIYEPPPHCPRQKKFVRML